MTTDGVLDRAAAFLHAILWGEHTTVWDLLSEEGRNIALGVAIRNGLDRVTAGRIREGLADPNEREAFLRQLLGGLRRDLRSVDLEEVEIAPTPEFPNERTAIVQLSSPSLIPGTEAWSAGSLMLSEHDERGWLVDRLEPQLAGP